VNHLRRLSTARLVVLFSTLAAAAISAGAIAVVASGGGGAVPASKPLAEAAHDALTAPEPAGVTARIKFTNNLLPSGDLLGNVSSALLSGASGRLWTTNDGHGRIELQSQAGDTQITWNPQKVSVYDASSSTVYEYPLPQSTDPAGTTKAPPTLADVTDALTKIAVDWALSGAVPGSLAGLPAYSVTASPKANGGLFGEGQLTWDATHGVPLHVAVTAKGSTAPVLELAVTEIAFDSVSASDVTIAPPADAKVVDLGQQTAGSGTDAKPVTGLDNVRAAVPFTLVAPATVGGQTLSSARTAGKGALLTYGDGLGALIVHETAADTTAGSSTPSLLGSLPVVTVGSAKAHELETPLGTVLTFDQGGVNFLVGGSMTKADAEAAAGAFAA
jgi:outer membrane lipoprotein-sorting protein